MTLDQILDNETTQAMLLNFASSMLSDNLVAFLTAARTCRTYTDGSGGMAFQDSLTDDLLALYQTFLQRRADYQVPLSGPLAKELQEYFEPRHGRVSSVAPLPLYRIEEVRRCRWLVLTSQSRQG